MSKVGIVFPHQLFEQNILFEKCEIIYLIEEWLYFKQYNFHKQKIAFHRASMKFYESYFQSKNTRVVYIDSFNELADVRKLIPHLKTKGVHSLEYIDTTDCWLEQRISKACKDHNLEVHKNCTCLLYTSPSPRDRQKSRMPSSA